MISAAFWRNHRRLVLSLLATNLRLGVGKMKAKNGLKKMTMTKGEDIPFPELQKRYLKKCMVNNLSEYTIMFYETSCKVFNKFICLSKLMVSDVTRDLMDDYILHTKRGVYKHSLHLFRHTFANMWIINKGDIFSLQKILGHSSLKQVNHYANLAMDDVKRNFDSFCALESVVVSDRSRIIMD